jgi:hypothetical protein
MRILALSIAGLVAGYVGALSPAETKGALSTETPPPVRVAHTLAGGDSADLGACGQRMPLAHAAGPATCDAAGLSETQPLSTAKRMRQASDGDCTVVDAYTGACAER